MGRKTCPPSKRLEPRGLSSTASAGLPRLLLFVSRVGTQLGLFSKPEQAALAVARHRERLHAEDAAAAAAAEAWEEEEPVTELEGYQLERSSNNESDSS